jgi:coiled-coil domain-containing protein 61
MGSDSVAFDQTAELTFHNVEYIIHAFLRDETLVIETEQKNNGQQWISEFSLSYIEEMTHKTGNFKKFNVFVKMLSTALSRQSEAVFVDLLTFADLEMLKNRKTGKPASSSAALKANNKRYLILTYVVEFDRVHYPLPLRFEDAPAPEVFRRTIARLRDELEIARNSSTPSGSTAQHEIARLRQENLRLQQVVVAQEREEGGGDDATSERESELEVMVADLQQRMDAHGNEAHDGMDAERIRDLEQECEALAAQVEEEQTSNTRQVNRNRKEQRILVEELEKRAESERAYRLTCRRLKTELEKAQADLAKATKRGTGAGPGRPGTAGASTSSWIGRDRERRENVVRNRSNSGTRPQSAPRSQAASRDASPKPKQKRPETANQNNNKRSASRPSSRGGSRNSSRGNSPAPRPASPARFDPSAYVREREERRKETQRALEAGKRSERVASRGGSRDPSPARRSAAAESRPRRDHRPMSGSGARSRSNSADARTRAAVPVSKKTGAESPRATYNGSKLASMPSPIRAKAGKGALVQESSRRSTPIKAKRNAWGDEEAVAAPEDKQGQFNATQEISDINERINALQYFLKAAKSGGEVPQP